MVKPFEAIFLTMDVKKNAKDVYLLSEDDLSNRECHQSTGTNQDHYYCPLYHMFVI